MYRDKLLNILVVEDNEGDYTLLNEYIHMIPEMPVASFHATTMEEAARLVKQSQMDVVMLDLFLPDSTGVDSVIMMDRLLPLVPIIVFSGIPDVESAREAISLGAQDYLVKGEFDEKILFKAIHYSLERKRMLQHLRQSNERYELVNKATKDTIWEWSFADRRGTWGEGFIQMFGYSTKELSYGDDWIRRYIHPEDRERVNQGLHRLIESRKQRWQHEYRFRCSDGNYKYVHDRGFLLYDEEGLPVRMIGAITDISDKRKMEKELADQEMYQQKLITEVTIQAQEKERDDLGRELHDNINQVLATIKMYLSMSLARQEASKDLLTFSLENVNYAIEEIRKLSRSLVSPSLGDMGLAEALLELANEINFAGLFRVEVVDEIGDNGRLDGKMELMCYRIAQEQLNNIRKYARAKNAVITVRTQPDNLFLSVIDDGVGFNPNQKAKGIGLRNIKSRVDFYSGTMVIESAPGKGCKLEINIPLS